MRSLNILNKSFSISLGFLWLINDIFLKSSYPGVIFGKVSDCIGLYLSPFILTGILYFIFKAKEEILFYFSIAVVFLYFSLTNINQSWSENIHGWLSLGLELKGTSDPSDLFCLPSLVIAVWIFRSCKNPIHSHLHRWTLVFFFCVFINSPEEPSGRSDFLEYFLARESSYDKIILLSPVKEETINFHQTFKFTFIGRNNESTPRGIEEIMIPEDCSEINEIPKETNYFVDRTDNISMKFISYQIRISKANDDTETNLFQACQETDCVVDLESLDPGQYFWSIGLIYEYIRECTRYRNFSYPRQTVESFRFEAD